MPYLFGIPALLIALYFATCEVVGTFEYLHADQGGWNYVVFAGMGIAAVLAVLPAYASYTFKDRKGLSACLWLLFLAALLVVVAASVGRTGSAADTAQSDRDARAGKMQVAREGLDAAERDVTNAQQALERARQVLADKSAEKNCLTNCVALLTSNVASAQAELETARTRRDAALKAVGETKPTEPHDPLYRRIAAASFGMWNEEQVRTAHPIAVPVLTSLLSAAFMAVAVWCFGPLREARRAVPPPPEDVEPDEHVPEEPAVRPLALPVSGPGAAIAEFVAQHVTRDEQGEVSMRELLQLYEAQCSETGEEPIDRAQFARELAALCQRLGIQVRIDGREAYIVGAAMAA